MSTYKEVADRSVQLCAELFEALPVPKRAPFYDAVNAVREAHMNANFDKVYIPGAAVREYWDNYRSTQQFKIEEQGENDTTVTGLDALAELLKWKLSTIRQRFANGRGVINTVLRSEDGLRNRQVTITRLKG